MTVTLPISRVTVHPDGATVYRQGPVSVQAGRVSICKLPLLLRESTLRVQTTGGTLLQSHLDVDLPLDERHAALSEEVALTQLAAELAEVQARIEHGEVLRDLLYRIGAGYDPEARALTAARLQAWIGLDAAVTPWTRQVHEQIRTCRVGEAELLRERDRLRHALAQHSSEAVWQRWAPTRRLDLEVRGEQVDVELSYAIEGARWSPAYAIDLEADLSSGRFSMRALVGQDTGEDWKDVELTLSTAPCLRTIDLPELPTLRLGTQQPPRPTGWRPLPADLDRMFGSDAPPPPSPPQEPVEIWEDEAEEADDDIDGSFDRELRATMPFQQSAPMPEMRSAKGGRMFGALGGVVDALGDAFAGGGAPAASGQRVAMPVPASFDPRAARAPAKRRSKPVRPPQTGVEETQLDYANLRVHPADAGEGLRGRLYGQAHGARFLERGLPSSALDRWMHCYARLVDGTHTLFDRPLPPHHVVPGPVQGCDVAFVASGTVNVPSDGRFHAATLFTDSAEVQITHRAVPRHDTRVFRRVTARLGRSGALPPGPLEASIEGALEIVAPFEGAGGDASITFGMGADEDLELVRNVRYDEQSAGLLGGSRRFSTHIQVEVSNNLPSACRIELLERIPVPVGREPRFEETESSPPTEVWKGEDDEKILKGGRRQWLEVRAGEKATARLSYAVTLSNKEELNGGDRRG